jgi:hypothetical protein
VGAGGVLERCNGNLKCRHIREQSLYVRPSTLGMVRAFMTC